MQAEKPRTKYRTTTWKAYNAALKARGALTMWLDKDMRWLAEPSGKRGRSQTFSSAAIQFCLSIKRLFGLALRQTLDLVESLLRLAKLDWPVPDCSTVCRRQKTLQTQISYWPSTEPLQLLIDSTGVKFLAKGEWKRKMHGAEYRRDWRKVHLGIDAQTLEIRAIEVTSNAVGDAPMLPEMLAQIPPRKNASLWQQPSPGAQSRNEAVRACGRLGSRIWKTWSGYHWRSLVETKMHGFERLGKIESARPFHDCRRVHFNQRGDFHPRSTLTAQPACLQTQ